MEKRKVLIVDDDAAVRMILEDSLLDAGFDAACCSSGEQAFPLVTSFAPDAMILDMRMPGMSGLDVLTRLKETHPDLPVIILTGYADLDSAVQCVKLGAYDFLEKPPVFEKLKVVLQRAIESREMNREIQRLSDTVNISIEQELGASPAMKRVVERLEQIARSGFSVIIEGETGTGKSRIARFIHALSGRAKRPFIPVDLGAIPETLVESELFGHEKGAFTGADRKRIGYFEQANGGTIFIDEMENISPFVQSKLLSVVEERRLYPLGGTKPVDIDVRLICATNTDIRDAVRGRRFREDLFFRLGEVIVPLPPLRERTEDIAMFVEKFLSEASDELSKRLDIDGDTVQWLKAYHWPGNIRELKNVIRRAALFADEGIIRRQHIDLLMSGMEPEDTLGLMPLADGVRIIEKRLIRLALDDAGGNKTKASATLQIDYKTLLNKMKLYDMA